MIGKRKMGSQNIMDTSLDIAILLTVLLLTL
jgi:hypothetical protein